MKIEVLAFGGSADCCSHAIASREEECDGPGSEEAVGIGHEDCAVGGSEGWHCEIESHRVSI